MHIASVGVYEVRAAEQGLVVEWSVSGGGSAGAGWISVGFSLKEVPLVSDLQWCASGVRNLFHGFQICGCRALTLILLFPAL